MVRRVLILGGTGEARRLAAMLSQRPDLEVTLSLAGRTASPMPQPVPTRVGGFGGIEGLAAHLRREAVAVLIDATHPHADQISANARAAAGATRTPLVSLSRPPWTRREGDRWTVVASVPDAVQALGRAPRRTFLALGRQEVAVFDQAPQHAYLVRSVDPVEPRLAVPDATYILDRGPFAEAAELRLLQKHRIDAIVAKNSGGEATYGKIAAARRLGIEVVMIDRPSTFGGGVATIERAIEAVDHALASLAARGE